MAQADPPAELPPRPTSGGHRSRPAAWVFLAMAVVLTFIGFELRTLWRELDWLQADLAVYTKRLASGESKQQLLVQQRLRNWQRDPDLIGIRDAAALARLPAQEQKACQQLWAEVKTLLRKAKPHP